MINISSILNHFSITYLLALTVQYTVGGKRRGEGTETQGTQSNFQHKHLPNQYHYLT
jgi:hypothetical protein